jgi:hypothetical protein
LFSVWGWEILQNSTTLTAEIGHLMILFPQHEILNFFKHKNFFLNSGLTTQRKIKKNSL